MAEVIGAQWSEIDFDAAVWTIPGERMKAKRDHRVPLSSRAVEILRQAKSSVPTNFVFTNGSNGNRRGD